MMVNPEKEVNFGKYCPICKHFKKQETDDPCEDCLNHPVNTYSHKPVNFESVEE